MPNASRNPTNDLQEAITRSDTAHQIITRLATDDPSSIWQYLQMALSDVAPLAEEIARLRANLDDTRLHRANLAASALATIAAHDEGEPDPVSYLRDELAAQGYTPWGRA